MAERRWLRPTLWLPLLALVLYLPAAMPVVRLNPDAVEYLDLARRIAAGEGYVLGIKAYHFGEARVLHDGLAERAPLFPLLAATLLRAGGGLPAVQVMNALLAAACVMLVHLIGRSLFGQRIGTLAGLLAAASPAVLSHLLPPMTEALATSLLLLATWLVVRQAESPRPRTLALAGMVLGLGYLARPTTLVAVGALTAGALLAARHRRSARAPLGALLGGFVLVAAPVSLYSLVVRGTLSYSGQTYLYSVLRGADVREHGYGEGGPLLAPAQFVAANSDRVIAAVIDNTLGYLELLFLNRDWLLALLPAWPLAILAVARGKYPCAAWPVLLVASANFLTYAFTWSTDQDRYQLTTLLLLLPFAVDGLSRLGLGRLSLDPARRLTALHAAALVIVMTWSPTFVHAYQGQFTYGSDTVYARLDRGLNWAGPPQWVEDESLGQLLEWIETHTDRRDILAHGEPWPLTFFTQRPSTLLPEDLSQKRLRTFISDYRVAYVLLDDRDPDRRKYHDYLQALTGGRRGAAVGSSYRVFDTRALWQGELTGRRAGVSAQM